MEIDFEKREDEVIYTFNKIPTNMDDLADVDQYLDEPTFAPALFVMIMCNYENDKDTCMKMLDVINGPREVNNYDVSFYDDRFMDGKYYKPFSYIDGATPDNNYTPDKPYKVHVYNDMYGTRDEGYKNFLMKSSGSDSKRRVTVRNKPSVGLWYLVEEMLFADIREPKKDNEWA